jgi:hypothetical protein
MRAQLHASASLTSLDMRLNGYYNSSGGTGHVTGTNEMGTSSRNTELKDPRSKNAWFR